MAHAHTPYYVVQSLITNLLELDTCRTTSEREHALKEHITDQKLREKMFLLNDLLGTHVRKIWRYAEIQLIRVNENKKTHVPSEPIDQG